MTTQELEQLEIDIYIVGEAIDRLKCLRWREDSILNSTIEHLEVKKETLKDKMHNYKVGIQ